MKLTSIFAGAALAACLLSGPALADPAAAPPSPDAGERLRLAHQLLELSGGEKAVDQRIDAMFAESSRLVALNASGDASKFTIAIQHDMRDEMMKIVPSLLDVTIQAYADNLTTQELRDYVAWLSSDSGKAIIAKTPAIQHETLERATPMMAQMFPELQHKVSERVCEELHCSAEEHRIVADLMTKAFTHKS